MKIDKIYLFSVFIIVLTIMSWVTSCTHNANIDNIPDVCFDRDVLIVFQTNCSTNTCHNGTGDSRLLLDNYTSISQAVVPGKPYSSSIYKSIIATSGENRMPPDKSLTLENRTIIRLWIEQGAKSVPCPGPKSQASWLRNDETGTNKGYLNN
jgi:hypothetical protein